MNLNFQVRKIKQYFNFKLLLVVLIGIVVLPLAIWAINTVSEGYKISPGENAEINAHGTCKDVFVYNDSVRSFFFKPDGTKMYLEKNDMLYQYTLSTPWDISTAVKDSTEVDTLNTYVSGGTGIVDIFFNSDGTRIYSLRTSYTCYDSCSVIIQYTLSTPWDISTAVKDGAYYPVQDNHFDDIFFNPDGTKMYLVGVDNKEVYQYTLSNPWNISSGVVYDASSSFSDVPDDIFFKPDGTKMYLRIGTRLNQFVLSTPWDISTAGWDGSRSRLGGNAFLKPDGTEMYSVTGNYAISRYPLSTPWDIQSIDDASSTVYYTGVSTYFVPTRSAAEWSAFRTAAGSNSDIGLDDCDLCCTQWACSTYSDWVHAGDCCYGSQPCDFGGDLCYWCEGDSNYCRVGPDDFGPIQCCSGGHNIWRRSCLSWTCIGDWVPCD